MLNLAVKVQGHTNFDPNNVKTYYIQFQKFNYSLILAKVY